MVNSKVALYRYYDYTRIDVPADRTYYGLCEKTGKQNTQSGPDQALESFVFQSRAWCLGPVRLCWLLGCQTELGRGTLERK